MVTRARRAGYIRKLSSRERKVLELTACDRSPAQIAGVLDITQSTVDTHIQAIHTKLRLHSSRGLVSWAWRSGWMTNDPTWALEQLREQT